jgi:hypothetical protein
MIYATTAHSALIPSELSGTRSYGEVQDQLVLELAQQRLESLGFTREEAASIAAAVKSECRDSLMQACRVTSTPDGLELELDRRSLRDATATLAAALQSSHPDCLSRINDASGYSFAKVVGINWKGLLIVVLPLIVVIAVGLSAGGSAGELIAAAAIVGLLLALFVSPKLIFGER